MRKIFTLLIVAILATATSWADTWTWTASTKEDLGTKTPAAVTLNGKDWTVTRDNVNYTNFTYGCIQLGKSKAPEQVTLTTSAFSGKQISSVSISCASYNGNHKCSIKVGDKVVLTKQSTSTWSGDENSAKPISVEKLSGSGDISISFTDGTRALYIKSISVTYTDSPEPQKTVKSLAITGEPTNKEYYVGDAFSTDGLKVNATYDDDTQEDVTAKATWTRSPATFTEAGAVSVTATATFGGVSAETTCPVTVKTIANTKETAYTVAEAIKLIDNGKTGVWVYVKGVVSKIVTKYTSNSGVLSFNVSDDAAASQTFLFYRNQKDAENTYTEDPNIEVGATVIGYGILKKYNKTYEFDEGNYLVEYTAPFVPTYTYTWMVNGAEVKKSVLKEGVAVEAPANPENIDGKVFTGWVTTATVDANKKPEYATIDATAKANTTYYAVFATKTEDGGEKWVKKPASEITEEGVYALITKDGNAFNGEIKSGHGQSTATTFMFDKNNEATSAPDGTCELTFVKKGEGYSINRDGTNIYKYLYSDGVGSGKLKWGVAEQNYWYYDETKGSWAYKVKDTETAYLNVYNTNNTFRTYYQAGSTSPVYFAQKVAGAGYADFTTIVKTAEVTTLANLAVNGAEGAAYQVNDVMVVAKKFQAGNKNYIVVKDAAQAVRNLSAPTADDKSFNINGNKQEEYTQNNWMLVSLPVELYNQLNEKSIVTSITGSLTEKFNVAMEATNVVAGEATEFVPNTYCALNFMGKSSVKGTNPAYTSSYYFATPKANEYAKVVWAVYNGGAFYLPSNNGSINVQGFKAAFNVDYSLNSVDNPKLTSGNVYSFEALVKEVAVPTTDAKSTSDTSTKFVVYPLDLDANKVATGVNDVNSAKEVKGVSYFNMMGVESAQPFDGVNIMVTTYTDGTQSATKVLR